MAEKKITTEKITEKPITSRVGATGNLLACTQMTESRPQA